MIRDRKVIPIEEQILKIFFSRHREKSVYLSWTDNGADQLTPAPLGDRRPPVKLPGAAKALRNPSKILSRKSFAERIPRAARIPKTIHKTAYYYCS